jgi:hypothetical protein
MRFLQVGHPGTTTPLPPCAMEGGWSTKQLKSCRRISCCSSRSKTDFCMIPLRVVKRKPGPDYSKSNLFFRLEFRHLFWFVWSTMLRNRSNIQRHREDICRIAGLTFSDDLLEDDYFIARFSPALRDRLDSLGLLNRGFCPLCGQEPLGTEYSRQTLGVSRSVVEYICKDCNDRTNPHLNVSGYTRRYYTAKAIMWALGFGLLWLAFLILKGCAHRVFS